MAHTNRRSRRIGMLDTSKPAQAIAKAEQAAAEPTLLEKTLPWLAGAGMALGHAAVANNCTLPQGRCSSCGSCIVVVGSLVAWAVAKKHQHGEWYPPNSP